MMVTEKKEDTRMIIDVRALERVLKAYLGKDEPGELYPEERFLLGWIEGLPDRSLPPSSNREHGTGNPE
jgi:hypothetical protein